MQRRYPMHLRRQVIDLSGSWDFAWLGEVALEDLDVSAIEFDSSMPVPGCFDALPAHAGRRGVVAYRRSVPLREAGRLRWVIDGAHNDLHAYIAGQLVGQHHGGFTRFHFDLGERPAGLLELVLVLDNRLAERTSLHQPHFDWYHYGGITRGCELHILPDLYFEQLRVETCDLNGPELLVRCELRSARGQGSAALSIEFDGQRVLDETVELTESVGVIERRIVLPGAELWSPESPRLHELRAVLPNDDWGVRVGIRRVTVEDKQLCINGRPIFLKGVNRHEAHPDFGHAVPEQLQLKDLQLLRKLGANFVRGSHYPQSSSFLDYCDELGFLVWNEAIGWQHPLADLEDEAFLRAQEVHIDEMLRMSENHACVVMWGILNEAESYKAESRPAFKRLLGRLKAADATRPVTFATCHPHGDQCLDLVDIISVNTYPGWYWGSLDAVGEDLVKLISEIGARQPGKPILVSEIGAGALLGHRASPATRWSEEYQAQLFDAALAALWHNTADCAGICIWQFCDCPVSGDVPGVLSRPRAFNNKGLLNEYRQPKLAFTTVAEWFKRPRSAERGAEHRAAPERTGRDPRAS